jgi:hypothetical protein
MQSFVYIVLTLLLSASFLITSCKSDSQHSKATESIEESNTTISDQAEIDIEDTAWEGDSSEVIAKDSTTELDKVEDISFQSKSGIEVSEKVSDTPKIKPANKQPKAKKKLGKIVFEEMDYDFGKINEGDTIYHKFLFRNEGEGQLEVLSAKATCGCTRPSFPFIPLEPGEQGYIGVEYISINKEGFQKPEITIVTNGSPKIITLFLTGDVTPAPKEDEDKGVKLDTLTPTKSSDKG